MAAHDLVELENSLQALSLGAPIPRYDEADVLNNPLDLCRSYLAELLSGLVGCEAKIAYQAIQWPNNIFNGDLTVPLPRLRPGAKPKEFAPELMKEFPNEHPLFLLPILDGVHLRIFLSQDILPRFLLPYILERKATFGGSTIPGLQNPSSPEGGRKKLVVEFSSPNITSEFQGKHLRSTIIGAFVSNLYEKLGWDVIRINYLGDWGKPIALLKVGWDKFGNEEAYQSDPIGHLLDVNHQIHESLQPEVDAKVKAREEAAKNGEDEAEAQAEIESRGIYAESNTACTKLEEGDEENVSFWKRVRDANIENYKDFYSQLGVKFDGYTGESEVTLDTMAEVEKMLKEKGICEENAGAWVVHMQKYGLKSGDAIIRYRNGATTYLLRELAAVLERSRKYDFDKMIIVAASDNSLHFTHLQHILKALDMKELADKIQHLRFSEVSKMTEKLGKGYRPQAIIGHVEETMVTMLEGDKRRATLFESPVKGANALGVAALLTHELSTRTTSAHSFDPVAMTAFNPGSGPGLQYWHAKLCSVLRDHPRHAQLSDEDYDALGEDDPANLLRILAQYPEIVHSTYNSLESSTIVLYLASVVEQLAECLDDDGDEADADENPEGDAETAATESDKNEVTFTPGDIALFEATRIVLENGMRLLGITPYAKAERERSDTPVAE